MHFICNVGDQLTRATFLNAPHLLNKQLPTNHRYISSRNGHTDKPLLISKLALFGFDEQRNDRN